MTWGCQCTQPSSSYCPAILDCIAALRKHPKNHNHLSLQSILTRLISFILCPQILDRLTKGVREAPSKALVGELAHSCGDSAAAAYSVRQVLATLGMLLGSMSAGAAFQLTSRSYTATFALSVVPALAGFGLVLTALGPDAKAADVARRQRGACACEAGMLSRHTTFATSPLQGCKFNFLPITPFCAPTTGNLLNSGELYEEERLTLAQKARALATALPAGYWQALATTSLLFLARFDVAFITIRASQVHVNHLCAFHEDRGATFAVLFLLLLRT